MKKRKDRLFPDEAGRGDDYAFAVSRFVLFGITATAVLGLVHLYLYRRLVRDVTTRPWLRRLGAALFVLGPLTFVTGRFVFRELPPGTAATVGTAVLLWSGLIIYLFLSMLVLGLARWSAGKVLPRAPGVDAARRQFLARATAGTALAASTSMVGFGAFRAFTPAQVTELPIKLPHLPRALDGLTIVQLTDVHVGGIIERRFLEERVAAASALKPDVIVITGDLVDGTVAQLGSTVAEISKLRSRYGTFFCTGNHDYYAGADEWAAALRKMGVRPLRNERVEIGDAGASFDLIGVDDWGMSGGTGRGYDLDQALAGRDPGRASVLLAHQPNNFEVVAQKGLGLQLSGHTHGGQFFPGTLIAELIFTFTAGLYGVGDSKLYVSRGTGFVGPPLRLGSPPELVKVVLTA
jgi:uncharacterized protein